jgi:signal transduction histidine kinase/HAMP domain-containing protein
LSPFSLAWRIPLAVVALALAWRGLGLVRWPLAGLAAAALLVDLMVPAALEARVWAERADAVVAGMQARLAALAEDQTLRRTLAASGGEAAPEVPFDALRRQAADLLSSVDALLLVDERGEPVAWAGERAQMPFRLRLLGERTVTAEPGVREAWLWWREPMLDGGRTIGELLAGVVIPESGARSSLGISVGRAAVIRPRWEGGMPLESPAGVRLVGVEVDAFPPVTWSAAGVAVVVGSLLLAVAYAGVSRAAFLGVAAIVVIAAGTAAGWRAAAVILAAAALVTGVAACAERALVRGAWRRWVATVIAAAAAALIAWVAPSVLTEFPAPITPSHLLLPTSWQLAVLASLTFLLLSAPCQVAPLHWTLRALAWLPLAGGVLFAEPHLLAVGAALVVVAGRLRGARIAPAIAAALIVVGSEDVARRARLVSGVEATLARMEDEAGPAQGLLESLPASGLAELVRLAPAERVVVLGRLAGWLGFSETLPGASLALEDAQQNPVAVWGQSFGAWELSPRELAARDLAGGWRVAVLAPQRPYDLLAALSSAGVEAPTAAFDRSGAPVARGGTFRPLPPERVGRALAEGTSWAWVSVGERDFRAYLRAYQTWVLAVPWVRPALPELCLSVAALTFWGAVPFALWGRRRSIGRVWSQRRTFTGRLRVLTAVVTLTPLLLLAQLLQGQWTRQQQRARLELGRALSQPLAATGVEQQIPWLVRDLGATVALYRAGRVAWSSRPDLVADGEVPWLVPPEVFVRAVRGWREPLVRGDARLSVFAPTSNVAVPEVAALFGLQIGAGAVSYTPHEWFSITALWAAVLALTLSERLGRRLARPLQRLVRASRRLERGESVTGIRASDDEEIAELGTAFVTMASTVQRREEELRRERDQLESVLATLSAAVLVLPAEGGCELANPSARRLLGDGDPRDALRARFGAVVETMLEAASGGETSVQTVRTPATPEALWQITVMPLPARSSHRLVVMEDLSEIARAERLASLAELARIVAHEVKNPLTPIRLWAEELQAALEVGPQRVEAIARTAAVQILDRVRQLRDVAQGFSNLVALEHWDRDAVELGAVICEVAAEYAVAAHRGIVIRTEADAEVWVMADPTWVRRALRHLLDNSIRAIGARDGEVTISLEERAGAAVLSVRDSGGGVPEGNLGRLFEPHFSTTSEGSGLGLAVVHRVMERAGGRAEARNVAGGLEVRLTFAAVPGGKGTV